MGLIPKFFFLSFLILFCFIHSSLFIIFLTDNVAIHRMNQVSELIEKAGSLLIYLPPYSPDMNPIEEAFSKEKHFIRMNNIVMESVDNPETLDNRSLQQSKQF